MANSDIIKSKDVIQPDLFRDSIDSANEFAKVLEGLEKGLKDLNTESNNFLKTNSNPKNSKQLKETTDALDKANKSRKGLLEIELQAEKLKQAQLKTQSQQLAQEKKLQTEKDKALKQQQKELEGLKQSERAYVKASKNLNDMRNRYKDLALEGKHASKEALDLLASIVKLDKELKQADADVGQFQREVGNYSGAIEDAVQKTGFFGDVIGKLTYFVELYEASIVATTIATDTSTASHVASVGAIEAETVATEQLTLAKRVMNAVTSPVGVIIAISAAIAGLIGYVFTINQDFKDWFSNMKSGFEDLLGSGSEFSKLNSMIISFRKEINILNESLQELRDTEGDLGFVYNDNTLSLNERKKALEEMTTASILANKKAVEIAQKDFDIEQQRVKANEAKFGTGKGSIDPELYKALSESKMRLFDAKDGLADLLELEIPKREREFKEKVIINEIELIRSKKLGADSQVEILKKQVADEKVLIAERQKAFDDLTINQLNAQNEEIDLLTKFNITKQEINDLIAEKDAVALAKKLEEYGATKLGVEAQLELAKVVLEAQKNELERTEAQNKIDDKTIENKKTIAKINNEIAQNELNNNAELAKQELELAKVRTEKATDIAFSEFNLFNNEKIQAVKDAIQKEADLLAEANSKENEAIRKKYDDQIAIIREGIKNNTKEKGIGDAEIDKLTQERDIELQNKTATITDKKAKFETALRLKQNQQIAKEIQGLTDNISDALDVRANRTNQAKDKEIDKTKTAIDRQRELAEKGFANQLAFEETQLAKRELQQKEALEKQARQKRIIQLTDAYFNAYNARLVEVGGDPNTAGFRALGDVALAEGVSKGVVQFAKDGNNMIQGAGTETSDSIPFMLSKNEAVVKAKENVKHNDAVISLNAGTFDKDYLHVSQYREATQNIQSNLPNFGNVEKLLQKLIDKPTQSIDVDSFGNIRESIIKETQKIVITHKNSKLRL